MASALVFVVDLGEFGVDDFLFAAARLRGLGRAGIVGSTAGRGSLLLLVDRLAKLHRDLAQCRGLRLRRLDVAALDGLLGLVDRRLDLGLQRLVDLVAMLRQLPLGAVGEALGAVLRLRRLAALLVLVGE